MNGASTTRPSTRPNSSPSYTHLPTVTSKLLTIAIYPRSLYHEYTSLLRNAAIRKSSHRKLPGRAQKLGAHSKRIRMHLLYRGSARHYGLPGSGGAAR